MALGLLLALVVPRLAVAAPTDYKEITFNMTFPPITSILQFKNKEQWTVVPSDVDMNGFTVRGLTQEGGWIEAPFDAQYIGSAIYFSGAISTGQWPTLWVQGSEDRPWSNSEPNIIPGANGVGVQQFSGVVKADVGDPPNDNPRPWFHIKNVTIASTMRTQVPSFEKMGQTTEDFLGDAESTLNPRFVWEQVSGNWSWDLGGAWTKAGSPSVKVPIPDHTSLVIVNGTRGPDAGALLTKISPPPPHWTEEGFTANLNMPMPRFSQPLLYAVLDPTVKYTMTLTAQPRDEGTSVQLKTVTYYSAFPQNDDKGTKGTNTHPSGSSRISMAGVIAGTTIGGIVVVGLAICGLFHYVKRRLQLRKRKRTATDKDTFPLDIDHQGLLTAPFATDRDSQRGYALDVLTDGEQSIKTVASGQRPQSHGPSWSRSWTPDSAYQPSGMAPAQTPGRSRGNSGVSAPGSETATPKHPTSDAGIAIPPRTHSRGDRSHHL